MAGTSQLIELKLCKSSENFQVRKNRNPEKSRNVTEKVKPSKKQTVEQNNQFPEEFL
jgi:hypothetical protein